MAAPGVVLPPNLEDLPDEIRDEVVRGAIRSARYRHLGVLWAWSSLRRVRMCGRARTKKTDVVEVGLADGVASMRGIQRCGSVHVCPCCAPKIRHGRAQEINQAGTQHLEAGGSMLFITCTVPHKRRDALAPLWSGVAKAWGDVTESDFWLAWGESRGIELQARKNSKPRRRIGVIRSLELTDGRNGWHPHLHNLAFLDRPLGKVELDTFTAELHQQWADACERQGLDRPSEKHGVKVVVVESVGDLAPYLCGLDGTRIDLELARGDLKHGKAGGRSPWAILASVATWGDQADLARWWEYEAASYRKNAITWSQGMKRRYGIVKMTDQELAEESVGHQAVLILGGQNWLDVCKAKLCAPLLNLVERGDRKGVIGVLERAGCVMGMVWWADDPDRPPPG